MDTPRTGPKPKQMEPFQKMGIAVGRDKTHIDPEEVEKLAALGVTTPEMSDFFGIHESTLKYNFKRELTKGRSQLKITLRRSMLQNAHNMNASVQIFLAKNLLGMADQPINQVDDNVLPWVEAETNTNKDSGKIEIQNSLNSQLTLR
jgi:AraC-like DNA-binding protein